MHSFLLRCPNCTVFDQVPGREETVRRTTSGVPAEPREARQDAWQHPGHVAPRLAPFQAAQLQQDDHRPGQPGQGQLAAFILWVKNSFEN